MTVDAREGIERWLARVPPYPGGAGRGVVIPAGGAYLVGAWVIIGLLRHLGCLLPVEIWHQGPAELTPVADAIARRFSRVKFCDIGRSGGAREKGGWQLKAEALARTGFREALLLDADNHPLSDPIHLFGSPELAAAGTLFWRGPTGFIEYASGVWPRFGLTARTQAGIDSAQILVDRERAWTAIAFAEFLNQNSAIYWRDIWGDADTFVLAWLKTETPFWMSGQKPPLVGRSMYYATPAGKACFRHRFDEKWSIKEAPPQWDKTPSAELLRELRDFASMHGGVDATNRS